MTNANRNKIYKYKNDISWICPLDIYYVFNDNEKTI